MADNFTDGSIYVQYNHLENAADDMVRQTKAIAGTLSNLEQELQALRNSWYGNDKDVYSVKQAAWDQAVHNMEQLLVSHAGLLSDVSDNYKYSENSLSQMWSEVSIGR
jgi:WXG100 family type VII secretion target